MYFCSLIIVTSINQSINQSMLLFIKNYNVNCYNLEKVFQDFLLNKGIMRNEELLNDSQLGT